MRTAAKFMVLMLAVLLAACSVMLHILFTNATDGPVTIDLIDQPHKLVHRRVGPGWSKRFPYGATPDDAALSLSTRRCRYTYHLPPLSDGWDFWQVRVRLQQDMTLRVVPPIEESRNPPRGVDPFEAYGVTVPPASKDCADPQ